jgi:SAM-dependent methyltransferase
MQLDVADLRDFYARPLGQLARRLLSHKIRARWRGLGGATLVGLGFATPFLGAFRGEVARLTALMPSGQGALVWPSAGRKLSALVEEDRLPLPDNSVDRLLVVHCLEAAERVRPLLRELWRVLAPDGRLMIIVPNRRGVWARLDTTPFGHGQPYSRSQLESLLRQSLFTPFDWSSALHMPPFDRRMLLKTAMAWERVGSRLWPGFAGVLIVEARKEVLAPIGGASKVRALPEFITVRREPPATSVPRDPAWGWRSSGAAGRPPSRPAGSAATGNV